MARKIVFRSMEVFDALDRDQLWPELNYFFNPLLVIEPRLFGVAVDDDDHFICSLFFVVFAIGELNFWTMHLPGVRAEFLIQHQKVLGLVLERSSSNAIFCMLFWDSCHGWMDLGWTSYTFAHGPRFWAWCAFRYQIFPSTVQVLHVFSGTIWSFFYTI
jgi:hypothetical protein